MNKPLKKWEISKDDPKGKEILDTCIHFLLLKKRMETLAKQAEVLNAEATFLRKKIYHAAAINFGIESKLDITFDTQDFEDESKKTITFKEIDPHSDIPEMIKRLLNM